MDASDAGWAMAESAGGGARRVLYVVALLAAAAISTKISRMTPFVRVKLPILTETITLPLEKILPSETLKAGLRESNRYKMIAASVREVGVIEPLVVYPELGKSGKYMLLDGHVRLEVLRDLGHTEVECLVSTDDEGCTYKVHISRLAPIRSTG